MLRRTADVGRYIFNRPANKTRRRNLKAGTSTLPARAWLMDFAFARVQELLTERNPRKTKPRVVTTAVSDNLSQPL